MEGREGSLRREPGLPLASIGVGEGVPARKRLRSSPVRLEMAASRRDPGVPSSLAKARVTSAEGLSVVAPKRLRHHRTHPCSKRGGQGHGIGGQRGERVAAGGPSSRPTVSRSQRQGRCGSWQQTSAWRPTCSLGACEALRHALRCAAWRPPRAWTAARVGRVTWVRKTGHRGPSCDGRDLGDSGRCACNSPGPFLATAGHNVKQAAAMAQGRWHHGPARTVPGSS